MIVSEPTPFDTPQRARRQIVAQLLTVKAQRNAMRLGEILVRQGCMTEEQVRHVLTVQKKRGRPFGDIVVAMRLANREDVDIARAIQHGFLHEGDGPVCAPKALVTIRRPDSAASEQIRMLRARLMTTFEKDRLSLFAVTPAAYNVRAEFIAANLATSFAQMRKRVLLVDADLARPRLARIFEEPPGLGLGDMLEGKADFSDAAVETIVRNLALLPAGSRKYDREELLAGDRLDLILEEAHSSFDVVMVLTAPAGKSSGWRFAARACGAALPAARRDFTRARELKAMASAFRQLGVEVLGAAMTR